MPHTGVRQQRGWTFMTKVFVVFMLAGLFTIRYGTASRATWFAPKRFWPIWSAGTTTVHPIPTLMADAKDAFIRRLRRQSKTLPEAVAEYKRRYKMDPPRGFDHWWAFAKENDFKFVDEFDAIVEDLAPFWRLSGEALRQRTYQAAHLPSVDLVRIQDGEVRDVPIEKAYVDKERGHVSLGFRRLLEKLQHKLPNIDMAINLRAECRVLVPWEHLHFPDLNHTVQGNMTDHFSPEWGNQGNVWEAYRRACPPDTQARRAYTSYRDPGIRPPLPSDAFAFVEALGYDYDFCEHPWARYTQGHFFSDWRTVPVLYPVFSPAKAKGFADIRIPSQSYYTGSHRHTYGWDSARGEAHKIDRMEVPWENKSDRIFWRGATTGGGSAPPWFTPTYQRHRLLRMTHESTTANVTVVHASPSRPDTFVSTTISAKDVNDDIMDVAFVTAVGSYPGGETELRKHHRFASSVPLGKHWSYKYLVDLDGMSYSGRFMGLMASDSAVLKSTVYKEYFSDWIQPWLHFIPLSSSYSEIYNIHAYFSGPSVSLINVADVTVEPTADVEVIWKERDGQLRQIGRAGKQWKHTIGRAVDMEVYVYRLCLEYARLWADDRDTMRFVL